MSTFFRQSAQNAFQQVKSAMNTCSMEIECRYANIVRLSHQICQNALTDEVHRPFDENSLLAHAFAYVVDCIMSNADANIMRADEVEKKTGDRNAVITALLFTVAEEYYADDKRFESRVAVDRNTGVCALVHGPAKQDSKNTEYFSLAAMLKMPAMLARLRQLFEWRGYLIDLCNANLTSTDKTVRANRRYLSICLRALNRRNVLKTVSM